MAAFVSQEVSLVAATATKIVDSENFDRDVRVYGDAVRVAFASAAVATGARVSGASLPDSVSFILPADEELWAYHGSGSTVGFLATNTV